MPFTSSTSTTTEESNPGTAYPLTRERQVSIATGSSLVDMDTAPSFSRQEPIRAATTKGIGGQGDDLGYVVMNRAQTTSCCHVTAEIGQAGMDMDDCSGDAIGVAE